MSKKKVIVVEPGHFHAALVFKQKQERLDDEVNVYSRPGPELEQFLSIVESFNQREDNPTQWNLKVHRSDSALEQAISDKIGDIAILAGRNDVKMKMVRRLAEAGMSILSDKPLLTEPEDLEDLEAALKAGPVVADLMTASHSIPALVQRELIKSEEVFGGFDKNDQAAMQIGSVHHLYKIVNGAPLVRPDWYFDVKVQGEGIIDVTTHYAYLAQWFLAPESELDSQQDLKLTSASRSATKVPLQVFNKITGKDQFPESVSNDVVGDDLHYYSNGQIRYSLCGVPVELNIRWDLEVPENGGDAHSCVLKGEKSTLFHAMGPETGFKTVFQVRPKSGQDLESALSRALESMPWKGLSCSKNGEVLDIHIPDEIQISHEEQFSRVLDEFLNALDQGVSAIHNSHLMAKNYLLSEALKAART